MLQDVKATHMSDCQQKLVVATVVKFTVICMPQTHICSHRYDDSQ